MASKAAETLQQGVRASSNAALQTRGKKSAAQPVVRRLGRSARLGRGQQLQAADPRLKGKLFVPKSVCPDEASFKKLRRVL
jgi:hypothetical protein